MLVICAGLFFNEQVHAQDGRPSAVWNMEVSASYNAPVFYDENVFHHLSIGIVQRSEHRLSMGVFVEGYQTLQEFGGAAFLAGSGVILRYDLIKGERYGVFTDLAGSATHAQRPVPEFGTRFNWTGRTGAGGSWKVREGLVILAGVRFFHLSNGSLHGIRKNPGANGSQYWLGIMLPISDR